jgi:hypothetical protein
MNGKKLGSVYTSTQSGSASQRIFLCGSEQNDYCLNAYIADFRAWDGVLSDQEVKDLTAVLRSKFQLALTEP